MPSSGFRSRRRAGGKICLAVLLVIAGCEAGADADPVTPRPPRPPTAPPAEPSPYTGGLRMLFIGNSYTFTNKLPEIVGGLSLAMGDSVPAHVASVTYPGVSLEDHLGLDTAADSIAAGNWDVVIMQQGPSSLPESRDHLIRHARIFDGLIRAAGARPAMYMVWPSQDRPGDFDGAIRSYRLAADTVDGVLLPVGAAWRETLSKHPRIQLYSGDRVHPADAGSYLAAIVIYGCLSGRSPSEFPSEVTRVHDGTVLTLAPETAARLQSVAGQAITSHGRACARR